MKRFDWPRRMLALLLLPALLLLTAAAPGPGDGGRYIVKFRGEQVPAVVDGAALRVLLAAGRLEWYEPDGVAELLEGEDPGLYDPEAQWNLTLIGAALSLERGYLGQEITVGVIDSGISPHPDLEGRLLPGRSYVEDAADAEDTLDTLGHGTAVAGLIAGAGAEGCVGAAPAAKLVPLKCTNGNNVSISAICAAIYGGVDDFGCRVLNLSLGTQTDSVALREAVDYAASRGVTVVAAAGNQGGQTLMYPAAYETVLGVGSVDPAGDWYRRSNHNASVFLTAPGAQVRSLALNGGYSQRVGTSFATPQVSAAAAVLLGAAAAWGDGPLSWSGLSPARVMDLLAGAAQDRGEAGWDEYYGHGILDLGGALTALTGPAGEGLATGDSTATHLRNNTDQPLACGYLLAEYSAEGRLLGLRTFDLELPPGGETALEQPEADAVFLQLVWDPETHVPLTDAAGNLDERGPSHRGSSCVTQTDMTGSLSGRREFE